MNVHTRGGTWENLPAARRSTALRALQDDERQFHWMVIVGTLLLLLPAAVARLSGWRWQPWPSRPGGYGPVLREAREAAETYILFAFLGR